MHFRAYWNFLLVVVVVLDHQGCCQVILWMRRPEAEQMIFSVRFRALKARSGAWYYVWTFIVDAA
jgi:hypothetical protein